MISLVDSLKDYELSIIPDDSLSANQFYIENNLLTAIPENNISLPVYYNPTIGGVHDATLIINEVGDGEQYFEIDLKGESLSGNIWNHHDQVECSNHLRSHDKYTIGLQ